MKTICTKKSGFTLVELLISLAITAIMLVAISFAINGSSINYSKNEELFNSLNKARQALLRITTQIRTADAVSSAAASNECSLITPTGQDITFSYNSTDDKLYLVTNDDLLDADYVLCDNVTAMNFTKNTASKDGVTYVKSVQISITV
ncbi:MAG: type II secretion system protein, partial [Phycisphaerae bacterium]|nr:type II secretion system protein [Phycisphaerae bacterium]